MASEKTRITVTDVARSCGVAASTVSRVLNGDETFSVRPKIRERIRVVARELNYRPGLAARSLRARKTNLIAILGRRDIPTTSGLSIHATSRLVSYLHDAGYDAVVTYPNRHREQRHLPAWRIDAAVLQDVYDPAVWEELEQAGVPYVSMNGLWGASGWSVSVDDRDNVRQAMDHILHLGHRRVAYLRGQRGSKNHPSVAIRKEAYLGHLAQAGLSPLLVEGESDPVRMLTKTVVENQATAILAYDHLTAIDLLSAAWQLGLSVPRDFSLVCFNDVFPVAQMTPPADDGGLAGRGDGSSGRRTDCREDQGNQGCSITARGPAREIDRAGVHGVRP
ncbi:MAG TPA: LacI family DNA-binding transcriptional regulator [Phycisphaerae bacterium]|nr:LacI family DNA-binding transcriptional regulator [Phycisphaerae bacterium]